MIPQELRKQNTNSCISTPRTSTLNYLESCLKAYGTPLVGYEDERLAPSEASVQITTFLNKISVKINSYAREMQVNKSMWYPYPLFALCLTLLLGSCGKEGKNDDLLNKEAPTCTLTAKESQIKQGSSTLLIPEIRGEIHQAFLNGAEIDVSKEMPVSPKEKTTYTLKVTNAEGNGECTTEVLVQLSSKGTSWSVTPGVYENIDIKGNEIWVYGAKTFLNERRSLETGALNSHFTGDNTASRDMRVSNTGSVIVSSKYFGWILTNVSPQDGSTLWSQTLPIVYTSYTYARYLLAEGADLYACGSEEKSYRNSSWRIERRLSDTGKLVWEKWYDPTISNDSCVGMGVDSENLYAVGDGGYVQKRSKATGNGLWDRIPSSKGVIEGSAILVSGDVYVSGQTSGYYPMVQRRSSLTGAVIWSKQISIANSTATGLVDAGDAVLVSISKSSVVALSKANGTQLYDMGSESMDVIEMQAHEGWLYLLAKQNGTYWIRRLSIENR